MHIHIDSSNRHSGTTSEFSIDLSSISGSFTRTTEGLIGVKQVQIPYTFYNIMNGVNNSFRFVFSDSSSKFIYLTGNSTRNGNMSASVICANIATQLNANTSGQTFTCIIDSNITGCMIISVTSGATSFSIDTSVGDKNTYKVIGFYQNAIENVVGNQIYGVYVMNVTPRRYLYVKTNIPMKNGYDFDSFTQNVSGIIAKIPVAGPNISLFSNVLYEPVNINMRLCGPVQNMVNFSLYDDQNTLVDLNGLDWSMTLIYENQKTYNFQTQN